MYPYTFLHHGIKKKIFSSIYVNIYILNICDVLCLITFLLLSIIQVMFFSCQCSHHITSESIIDVFNTAKKFQKKQEGSKSAYVAVVVLDEVGLAEDSPYLPLKVLHPLLEDGTEGSNAKYTYEV